MENIKDKSIKNIVKGAGLVIFGIFISKILGYIYRIMVARTGTEPYGLLSIGLALFGIIVTLSLLGLEMGVLRFVSYYKSKKDVPHIKSTILSALKISLPLSIILATLAFILSGWLANNVFHNPNLEIIFKIIAISAPFDVLGIMLFQVNRAFQIVKYEVFIKNIAENVIKIVFLIILIFLGYKLLGPTLAYVIGIISSGILALWITQKKIFSFLDKKIKCKPIYKKIFSFSWPLLLTNFLVMIMLWTDTLMIGYFKNASDVGIYNAALPTANMLFVIPYAFSFLFIPILTDFYARKDWSSFKHTFHSTTRWVFIINILPLLVFLFLPDYTMHTLFGFNYTASIIPLMIVSVGYFINYLNINASHVLIVFKKTKLLSLDLLIAAILNITLNLFLIPKFGIIGAAIATSSSSIVLGALLFVQANKLTKSTVLDKSYLKVIISAVIVSVIILFVRKILYFDKAILSLLVNGLILLGLYILFLIIFKVANKEDKKLIGFIKKRFSESTK